MTQLKKIVLPLVAVFSFAIISESVADQIIAVKPQARNLFIIVMNGVRYKDSYGDKNHIYFDNIWNKLKPIGTICTKFENRELTLPIPAQASLLTGVWHVFKNPFSETIRPAYPTLFEYWNSARKDSINTVYFASSRPVLKILTSSEYTGFGSKYAPVYDADKDQKVNENAIYEKALPYIMEKHPSFVYLSLNAGGGTHSPKDELTAACPLVGQTDACGGAEGLNAYYESIILMDQIVYDLWDRIQKEDVYKDKTLLLVMSCHGRHTNEYYGYGDKCKGCTELFFLATGPGIKKNFVSAKGRTLIDVCKTVGTIFNMPTQFAKGDVMKELFE
jgi:hypothetical protein